MVAHSEIVTLTPSMAETWLERKASNRKLMEHVAIGYADAITRGDWVLNGEPIIFDDKDQLINGQHRCRAVVIANKPIKTFVTRGVKTSAFHTLDQHSRRTNGQVLSVNGEKHYNTIAAALAWVHKYNIGVIGKQKSGATYAYPPSMMLRELAEYPTIRDSVAFITTECRAVHRFCSMSLCSALHFLFVSNCNKSKADAFFLGLADGTDLPSGSPIHVLRERLINNRNDSRKLGAESIAFYIVKTWNCYATGKKLGKLIWARDRGEEFPEIEG